MDATDLTLYQTSCVSGLASKYLTRPDSQVLVMVGSRKSGTPFDQSHLSAIPSLRKVVIWNRTAEKARILAEKMQESGDSSFQGVSFKNNVSLDEITRLGDLVSCVTDLEVALVKGEKLKVEAHLDLVGSFKHLMNLVGSFKHLMNLVGSFKHLMKECNDEAIKRGKVFVDNEAAMVEAGELVGGFERGVIKKEDIVANLVELAAGEKVGKTNSEEITVFKSVGSAFVDMLAAHGV